MTLDHPLLEDWRRRLEIALEMVDVDLRLSWFWRIRAKVLKYLILRYGEELPARIKAPPVGSRASLVLDLPLQAGRPLRTASEIRRVLERISGLA